MHPGRVKKKKSLFFWLFHLSLGFKLKGRRRKVNLSVYPPDGGFYKEVIFKLFWIENHKYEINYNFIQPLEICIHMYTH